MPKPYEEFRINDWDWIGEHFEPSKAERIAKVAWIISKSTTETIPQGPLTLNPFIVIPLCAIALQDDIKISVLLSDRSLRNAADEAKKTTDLEQQAQFIEQVLSAIKPSHRWQYLFSGLTPDLQFDLLYRLINYRCPTSDDWRNLFQEVKYEFKNSWHYRVVLIVALAISMAAFVGMVLIASRQPNNWINGLSGVALVVVITFWVFLWTGIEERLEPNTFIRFGLLGTFTTFWKELHRLLSEHLVWAGVETLYQIVAGAVAAAGAGVGTVATAVAVAVATRSGSGAWAWAGAWAWFWAGAVAGAWAGAGIGLEAWYRAKDFSRYFAVLAFPFFCWLPIVVGFTTVALFHFLPSWQYTILTWLAVIGICTAIWLRGQKLDWEARNPLKDILKPKTGGVTPARRVNKGLFSLWAFRR